MDPHDADGIVNTLARKVEQMVAAACEPYKGKNDPLFKVPLIRLKVLWGSFSFLFFLFFPFSWLKTKPKQNIQVDHTGFPTISAQRFGQRFVSKVANHNDIIAFAKKKPTYTRVQSNNYSKHSKLFRKFQTGKGEERGRRGWWR